MRLSLSFMTTATPSAPRKPYKWSRKTGLIDDPYAWLLDRDNPETLHYLHSENAFCTEWFSHHTDVINTLFAEIKTRVKEDDSSYPVFHNQWWYTSTTHTGLSYAIHSRGPTAETAQEVVLLDENREAEGHPYFSLSAFEVAHNNQLLAWSSDTDGSERYTVRIRNLVTGSDLSDEIPNTTWGGLAWSRDDQFLFYVTPDEAMRPWQVWRHQLGTPVENDQLIFEETDERFFVAVSSTRSAAWITIDSSSKTSSEVWLIRSETPEMTPICVTTRQENIEYQIDHWGDCFAILTNKDAQDFRVMLADETHPDLWRPFIDHVEGQRISGFDCFADFAVMQRWDNGQQKISLVDKEGTTKQIPIASEPHEAELDANPQWQTQTVRISYQSLVTPPTVASFTIATSQLETLKQTEVLHVNLDDYVAERTWATSQDGTLVPVDFVRHKKTSLDNTAPLLLYVYGAYEISTPPWFSTARLSLLDRGWVWALAHPRGGGELGRTWYENGKLLHKKNTFVDTIASARHLVDIGACNASRIVLRGGSAGGLAVGACITLAPEVFAGAIAEVPFVDVTNTMCDPSLPLTVTEWEEWGDPREEPYFSYISSYSPYDNVGSTTYPALYVTAGLNDPRVSFHEPAKWVAKMRHESPHSTVVFNCEMDAGHGGPSGRYQQWLDEARTLSFALAVVS